MVVAETASQVHEHLLGAAGVAGAVRLPQRLAYRRAHVFGELVGDVAALVRLAALDERPRAEDSAHGLRQRLRAVDNYEGGAVGAHPALSEISEQRGARRRVLRGALADPEDVLLSVGVDAEGDEQNVLVDVHAVEHHHGEVQAAEIASEPLAHLRLGGGDEPAAHRALTRPSRRDLRRYRFERPYVL